MLRDSRVLVLAVIAFTLGSILSGVGCNGSDNDGAQANNAGVVSAKLPADLFLNAKPANSTPLEELKGKAQVGDEVVFSARVGGRAKLYVSGYATVVIIDPAIPSCRENPGDNCPQPWDYCCEPQGKLLAATATLQVAGADGKPLAGTLEGESRLAPLTYITVVGKVVAKDDQGTFTVNASGIFVDKEA